MGVRITVVISREELARRDAVPGSRGREATRRVPPPPGFGTAPSVPRVEGRRRD
ncbi:hypothetical protein [Amycolatopsis sp. WAC 04182]|uniref:hypothetical protein n=1 Tax=Amycolatopsis sp. WAC 04182 TaxID=2203198 RepID=UPI0013158AD7|nr:hypothetical protein [Amycolatopsis sp. WAC 04182]